MFRKIEVKAFSRDEAIAQAPFAILKDATQAWKNKGKPMLNSLNEFIAEYLKKETKNAPGIGCMIVLEGGVADSRENPYSFTDIVNKIETGTIKRENKDTGEVEEVPTKKRKFGLVYEIIDDATNEIIAKSYGTKADARRDLAELYKDGYRGNATCIYKKEVVSGEARAFTAEYTPSKNTKLGNYLVFGVEHQ